MASERARGDTQGAEATGLHYKAAVMSYESKKVSTNSEYKKRGMISLIGIRLRESHVKYRVTDNSFYSVTGAAGLSFCSEGMAR